jgi:hypothetical protein
MPVGGCRKINLPHHEIKRSFDVEALPSDRQNADAIWRSAATKTNPNHRKYFPTALEMPGVTRNDDAGDIPRFLMDLIVVGAEGGIPPGPLETL